MSSNIHFVFSELENVPQGLLIKFIGDLDTTNSSDTLKKISGYFEKGYFHLVADFQQLRYINSMGLGMLLQLNKEARERNGSLSIVNINEYIFEIIELIGAHTVLQIHNTLQDAESDLKKN